MTDFETFSNNFDKIEKQHRKAGKAMVKGGVSLKFNLFTIELLVLDLIFKQFQIAWNWNRKIESKIFSTLF